MARTYFWYHSRCCQLALGEGSCDTSGLCDARGSYNTSRSYDQEDLVHEMQSMEEKKSEMAME